MINKSFFIILIVSIIFMFIIYFGIHRYIFLHIFESKRYEEKYRNLEKTNDEYKNIIVMFSKYENLHKIKPVINSVLDQTTQVDYIVINVPNLPKNAKIPAYIENSNIIFLKNVNNINMIPSILQEKEADTLIFVVDNDKILGKDILEELEKKHTENPNSIICVNKDLKSVFLIQPKFFETDFIDNIQKDICYKENLKKYIEKKKISTKNIDYTEIYNCLF